MDILSGAIITRKVNAERIRISRRKKEEEMKDNQIGESQTETKDEGDCISLDLTREDSETNEEQGEMNT
jgi:hypothetical protein